MRNLKTYEEEYAPLKQSIALNDHGQPALLACARIGRRQAAPVGYEGY